MLLSSLLLLLYEDYSIHVINKYIIVDYKNISYFDHAKMYLLMMMMPEQ